MEIVLADHPACVHDRGCAPFAAALHAQLSSGRYDWPASILNLDNIDSWTAAHRTARKRAARSARLGYRFAPISREHHVEEIFAINTSAPERQGRPMTAGYLEWPSFDPLSDYPCSRHRIDEYGVFAPDGDLVAYLVAYVCGDLAMVSQILGHADHLEHEIMYLLAAGTLRDTLERSGPVMWFYNLHSSGQDGLRFFKERLGFRPERVAWAL